MNVFQSVADSVPVAEAPERASVSAWPESVRPFTLFVSVTSPEFVPDRFVADMFPVNTAPPSFAYVVDAVVVERYDEDAAMKRGSVSVNDESLLLKFVQSAAERVPEAEALATGILIVILLVDVDTYQFDPVVEVAILITVRRSFDDER